MPCKQEVVDLIGVSLLFPSTVAAGALFAWADVSSFLRPGQSEKYLWCWLELLEDAKEAFPTGESILHWRQQGARTVLCSVPAAQRWTNL
jgi:hypothetical protein